jgi:cytochrome c peroxidase
VKTRLRSLALAAALSAGAWLLLSGSAADGFRWDLPAWVPPPQVPADNPMSQAKVELGRHLFYDPRLSADGSMSCATCHHQDKAFTDGLPVATGITGQRGARSAMGLANVAYLPTLTWANPLLKSLEVQALIPLFGEHPVEMGMAGRESELFQRLRGEATYRQLFARAFPGKARQGDGALYSLSTLTKAIAAFERSLLSFNSPYDRFKYRAEPQAISPAAKRGEALFFGEKMECYHCHGGFTFNDNVQHSRLPFPELGYHNTGLYNVDGQGAYPADNPGIGEFTGIASDHGRFRTASLRNVAVTAPYMHDGSIATLEDVIRRHYALAGRSTVATGQPSPMRSELLVGFEVSDDEVKDLEAFLQALTDRDFLTDPRLGNPWPTGPAMAKPATR